MRGAILALMVALLVAGKGDAGGVDGVSYGPAGGYGINTFAIDPLHPNILYAATRTGGLFKSLDGSTSWEGVWVSPHNTTAGNTVLVDPVIDLIAIDPHHPGVVYIRTTQEGLLKSTDSGKTWEKVASTLPGKAGTPSLLDLDPLQEGVIYAGNTGFERGLFRSTDGGKSWTRIHAMPVGAIVIDPQDPNTVYVGVPSGGGGVIRYTFSGESTAVEQSSWGELKKKSAE